MASIKENVQTTKTVTIDRDYCLEQAVLCLLGRSALRPPEYIDPMRNAGYSNGPQAATPQSGPILLPGPLEWAQAWRELAAEFPKR